MAFHDEPEHELPFEARERKEYLTPEELFRSIYAKLQTGPDNDRRKSRQDQVDSPGFNLLLGHILRQQPATQLEDLVVTNCGRIIGKVREQLRDIAIPEHMELWVGLCDIGFAIEMLCDLSERNGLSHAERAHLLNLLPRQTLSEASD